MLVFVSDFHFTDGTAGEHFLGPDVFASVLNDTAAHAREARAEEVTLVFLGDLFDFYRTERWFDYPVEQRPWGETPSDEALYDIFEGVVAANRETLDLIGGPLADRFGFPVEPKRLFVPGNHDRLINLHPVLRRRVRETLGLEPGDGLFPHYVLDEQHGVFARHGHEWDEFSFDGSEALDSGETIAAPEEDYARMPIGDSVACEFAARLGPLVREKLDPGDPAAAVVVQRMRDILDVRPLVAAMQWASWQAEKFSESHTEVISSSIREAAQCVRQLPFVQHWIETRDERGMDRADMFQALFRVLSHFELLEHKRILAMVDRISSDKRDIATADIVRDFERLDRHPEIGRNIYYLLYGHTHAAAHQAIGIVGEHPEERSRVYLNTGTWRPVHRPVVGTGGGFASWKELTYVLLYAPGEVIAGGTTSAYPAAEYWTGLIVGPRGGPSPDGGHDVPFGRRSSHAAGELRRLRPSRSSAP